MKLPAWMAVLAFAWLGVATPAAAEAMRSLADDELEAVSGREGVIVGLELYWNAQKSSSAAVDGTAIVDSNPNLAGNQSCAGSSAVADLCRTGWQFANRGQRTVSLTPIQGTGTQNLNGQWLVFKDSYMALKMPNLYLNGGEVGNARAFTQSLSAAAGYNGFFDISRFQNVAGSCLLPDGTGGTACTQANILKTPSLIMQQKVSVSGSNPSYNTATRVSSNYDSISLGFTIGRLAIEYDCTVVNTVSCPAVTNALGYNRDANGSFMGLNIRDNNSNFAGIAVGGRMYLYGF